jgi:hypothetical protein
MNMNDIFFHLLRLDINGKEKQPEITTTAMNIQSSLEDPRAIYNCQILLLLSLALSLCPETEKKFQNFNKKTSAGALTMSVKTLASCMQRKKKRKRMSANPGSTRSYTPRVDARTSMEHLLRRPSPGRRWTHRSRRA